MDDKVRCTGCNWDVAPHEIVWTETRNGETFTLCVDCDAETTAAPCGIFEE